ncbi:MAG: DMT family transporter [Synechococcus sp.]
MPSLNPWLLLLLAISAEVLGTSCLKLTAGFSRPLPTLVVLAAYATSMLLLSRVVQTIPLGITYALWSGLGIVMIVVVGMALVTAGAVTINLAGAGSLKG